MSSYTAENLTEVPNNTYGENIHVVEYEGAAGEFQCTDCNRVCNYIEKIYCCDEVVCLADKVQKYEGHFLKMCFRRHAIEFAIKAMEQGKRLVKVNGNCFHCRTTKQHEEGWCKSKTNVQLLKHFLPREEFATEKDLEKYLELRKTFSLEEFQVKVQREAKTESDSTLYEDNPKLEKYHLNRAVRKVMQEKDVLETKKNGIMRRKFLENLKKMQEAAIECLTVVDQKNAELLGEKDAVPPLVSFEFPANFY